MTYHVVVRLLLLLLLLLLLCWCGVGSGGTTGSSSTRANSGASTTSTDVGEQCLDVLALERLGEKRCPDGLELNTGRGGKGDDLVGLYIL